MYEKIKKNVYGIQEGAFKNNTNLKSVKISDGIKDVGYGVFAGCTNLKSVVLPKGINKISDGLFQGLTSLEEGYDAYVENLTGKVPEGTEIRVIGDEPEETPTPSNKSDVTLYYGDIGMDGSVDANDALDILKYVVKLSDFTNEIVLTLADVNRNGSIEATDASETLKIVVKLRDKEGY